MLKEPPVELKPAYTLTLEQLATLFNEAFAGYVGGNVQFNAASLAGFIAHESIDLNLSQVILRDDQPAGFGYITQQGGECRLAAFGIVPSAAHQGVGKALMTEMIAQAKARGDRAFNLEVIEQNPRAVKLYQGVGFEIVRRLVGCTGKNPQAVADVEAEMIDLDTAARSILRYEEQELPWQVNGLAMLRLSPPNVGCRLAQATAILSDPTAPTIFLRSLIVPSEARHQGQATRLLSALFAKYPEKTWVLSPIYPEEYVTGLAARFGFERQPISQWQMRLGL
jgi:ribosomal protein S18 acetylase RimI-like enzyme